MVVGRQLEHQKKNNGQAGNIIEYPSKINTTSATERKILSGQLSKGVYSSSLVLQLANGS